MPRPRWKRLSQRIVFENPWWRYRLDEFELPNGARGEYHVASTEGSVMIVPVDPDGRLVIVEQFRFLADRDSFEFPAGAIDGDELPLEAARRELAEETGLEGELELLGVNCPWNGVTDERCHVFAARALRPLAERPEADATEDFAIHRWSEDAFEEAIRDGTMWDGMSLSAYAMFRARRATQNR